MIESVSLTDAPMRPLALAALIPLTLALASAAAVVAAPLSVSVRSAGQPVQDAVVTLTPLGRGTRAAPVPKPAVMDQVGSEFSPRVLVVTRGSPVSFPNSDRTRHQVYSFSPAKRFELPLYTGTPPGPVVFDSAGIVTLGCNIHDWMKGYIVVVDTPYFGQSNAQGVVRIDAPPGDYLMTAWHERLPALDAAPKTRLLLTAAGQADAVIELPLADLPPPRGNDRLRALQDKFRQPARD
jgi:plastocyanin